MATRKIAGSRVLLTGASSGIGRALAVQLVNQGANVLAVARRGDRLEALQRELVGSRGRLETLTGDVTDPALRRAAIERVTAAFGGLDVLVNNAGSGAAGPFANASEARLRHVMEINFFAPAELIRLAIPLLQAGTRPMVVNIGSVLGHRGTPRHSEYCASKFALHGLSESLRAEFFSLGIDLLVVSPATTETEFFDVSIDAVPRTRRRRGKTAEAVARRTIGAIRRGRHEIVVSPGGKLFVLASRLFPRVLDGVMARFR